MANLRLLPASAVLGLIVGASSSVIGQTLIQDFNSGSDSAWERYDPFGSATFSLADSAYRIQADPSPSEEFGPGRAGSILTGVTVSDFTISVDLVNWDAGLQQSFGVVARVNNFGPGTTNGYFFNYTPGPSAGRAKGEVEISVLQNEARAWTGAAVKLTTDLDAEKDYRFVFTGIGDILTGSIYALDDLETSIVSIEMTDAVYLAGQVGLLVTDSSPYTNGLGPADATFDNFTVSAIPEPSTYALIFGGAALGFVAWRRGRKMDR
jgi:PEP-CTERM putative exosortase interaction domain